MCGGGGSQPVEPVEVPELPPLPPPRAAERLPSRAILLPQQRREVQQQFGGQPAVQAMPGNNVRTARPVSSYAGNEPPSSAIRNPLPGAVPGSTAILGVNRHRTT